MARTMQVMSLAVEPDRHRVLKAVAAKKKMNLSELVRWVLDKFPLDDDEVIPIVLKIPRTLMGNQEELQKWLDVRTNVIIHKLTQ